MILCFRNRVKLRDRGVVVTDTSLSNLLRPALTVVLPWGLSSCHWLVLLPAVLLTNPLEPISGSSVCPAMEPTKSNDNRHKDLDTLTPKIYYKILRHLQVKMAHFEIFPFIFGRFKKLFKQTYFLVCNISTIWLHWGPEPEIIWKMYTYKTMVTITHYISVFLLVYYANMLLDIFLT